MERSMEHSVEHSVEHTMAIRWNIRWCIRRSHSTGGFQVRSTREMARAILSTPYSIGYLSIAAARQFLLSIASISNRAGKFARPDDTQAVQAAMAANLGNFTSESEIVLFGAHGPTADSEGHGADPIGKAVNDSAPFRYLGDRWQAPRASARLHAPRY